MNSHDSRAQRGTPRSRSRYAFPIVVAAVLACVLVLVAIPTSRGKGITAWWALTSPVFAALIGILAAFQFNKEGSGESRIRPFAAARTFLICQFAVCVALLIASLLEAIDARSSPVTVALLSSCVVLVVMSGSLADDKKRRILVTIECVVIILVFALPIAIHYATLHGRGDLFAHLSLAEHITESGRIPHSPYESWSGWHVGVASLNLVSGIQTSACAILFVQVALLVAVPLIGSFIERLSGRKNLAAVTSAMFLVGPTFLTQSIYLTPTAMCFGLFAVMLWTTSIRRNFKTYVMFMILGTTVILSHSLSPVIIVVVLSAMSAIMILQRRNGRSSAREVQLNPISIILMAIMVLSYASLVAASFFNTNIAGLEFGARRVGEISAKIAEEPLLRYVAFSFSTNLSIFMIVSYLVLRHLRGTSILGIGPRSSLAFAVIAFLTFAAYVASVLPMAVFVSIQLNRWAIYGWLFAAITGGSIMLILTRRHRLRPWITATVAIALFLATLSAIAGSSYDTLPFRENKYGFPPTPYFMDSEIELGKFVRDYYSGNLSCDDLFRYCFYRYPTVESVNIDYSLEGFNNENGGWILRGEALLDRGLEYAKNNTGHYIDSPYVTESFDKKITNCVLDVGSSKLLILFKQ